MNVVLDSNVLLAAFGTRGVCEAVLTTCLAGHELVASDFILEEFVRHLSTKFRSVSEADARAAADLLRRRAQIVVPAEVSRDACRDADDLPVLGTAIAGDARVIVTGDKDLLALERFHGVEILRPRDFLDRLRS